MYAELREPFLTDEKLLSCIFSSPPRPIQFWGPPSLLFNAYKGALSPVLMSAGVWRWWITFIWRTGRERMEVYEGVSKSFRTGRLERELQMVQLSAIRCSCNRYFVSHFSEFCRHNSLCCFSTSNTKGKRVFRYRLSPETLEYILISPLA
jgi:hypothetical protein